MRVTLGAVVVLGLVVTVAAAQPPAPRERAAVFKAPQALAPGELPPVARGSSEPIPPSSALPSTPVTRNKAPGMSAPTGPTWLTNDPSVYPAAGLGAKSSGVRTLTPPTGAGVKDRDEPYLSPRVGERLRGTAVGGKQPAGQPLPQKGPPVQEREQLGASTAFRGTGANGAPVYAGPPAYRWYGWGSVTPGANPLAPAGQYPKASANWYAITGATPGAFPVPVSNAAQPAPGTEPPTYGVARTVPAPRHAGQPVSQTPPQHASTLPEPPRPEVPRVPPRGIDSKFPPGPSMTTPAPGPVGGPVSVPTITAPPLPRSVAAPTEPAPPALPPIPKPDPVAVAPPALPVIAPADHGNTPLPTIDPRATPEPKLAAPATEPKALPTSVTTDPPREQNQWKPAAPSPVQPGTWTPAHGTQPLPTEPPPAAQPPSWQSGGATVKPIVARGQIEADKPDPVATLIKQVCQGRAEGVEIRRTGTKKIQVCFETRTQAEAQKLVNDISKRPELTAYQIDFCVLVK